MSDILVRVFVYLYLQISDLILLMLNPEFRDRPFIEEIISRVQVLIEANEERL